MKHLLIIFFLLIGYTIHAQNPEGFEKMCDRYIKGIVPLASTADLKKAIASGKQLYILDSREKSEYKASHISGARHVGYDDFEMSRVEDIEKDAFIVVYCSIGYRSEKIGEKLKEAGYTKVFNLYGGIFNWVNTGNEVESNSGKPTSKVHGYNKRWSKWLNTDRVEPVLD